MARLTVLPNLILSQVLWDRHTRLIRMFVPVQSELARVEIFETILSEDLVIPPEILNEEDTHNSSSFSSENLEDEQLTEDSSVFYGLLPNVPVSLDIGNFIGSVVDDRTKRALLTSHWQPPPCYTFPHSFRTMKGKEIKRSLQQTHLDAFPWAVLSESRHGLFCKYCALLVGLVTNPFVLNYT